MSLVVEDGSGLANADSYISVAEATAWHASLGNAAWAGLADDTAREQALRNATLYMLQTYRERWKGRRMSSSQALDWPRYGASVDGWNIPTNVVPDDVAHACADLALKAGTGTTLAPDLERAVIRKKIGPLETEYDRYGARTTQFTAIDATLAPYLKGSSAAVGLVRS